MSGGQCQRVMIAIAIASKPRLLIADEPTTALDVTIQKQILDLLMKLQEEYGMALILITHDMGVVAETADRVVVLTPRPGRVAAEISVDLPAKRTWDLVQDPAFTALVGKIREGLRADDGSPSQSIVR
jgi:ABC-type dipeptide/oligopeptide/nickel transport system ATPase component